MSTIGPSHGTRGRAIHRVLAEGRALVDHDDLDHDAQLREALGLGFDRLGLVEERAAPRWRRR